HGATAHARTLGQPRRDDGGRHRGIRAAHRAERRPAVARAHRRVTVPARDADRLETMTAEAKVRLLTWIGLAAGVIGGLLIAFPKVLPAGGPWVQLALGIATLVLAFRARKIGIAEVEG